MTRRIRAKPKDPAVAAAEKRAQAFAAVGLDPQASKLETSADIYAQPEVRTSEGQRGNKERARRLDAFEALKDGLVKDYPGAYAAAKRLQVLIVTAMGEHDRGGRIDRVDCDMRGDRTDAMLAARAQADAWLALLSPRDASLLSELSWPSRVTIIRTGGYWRNIVAMMAHEATAHGQAAAVRAACFNLMHAEHKMQGRAA